jgi:hypothetical protein
MASLFAGCGSNTFNVTNPPPPTQKPVQIAFTSAPPAPPSTISIAQTPPPTITVAVTNDPIPNGAGVDWELASCQNGSNGFSNCNTTVCGQNSNNACGYLYLSTDSTKTPVTSSADNATLAYQPPASFPVVGNNLYLEIIALAVADPTKNQLAPVQITAFGSSLQAGNYVLQTQGVENSLSYQFAGVITLDGNGGVTGGEQTINFDNNGTLTSETDPILPAGSGYFLGPDGRGSITLNTGNNNIGGNGIETFTFAYLNSSHALIAQGDLGTAATGASATGTMDLQTSTTAPVGGYAFLASGTDPTGSIPTALGGILDIDSSSNVVTASSVIDEVLPGAPAPVVHSAKPSSGKISSPPDSFGMVTLNLAVKYASAPIQFTGYIVDATHIKLVESDNTPTNPNPPFASTAGVAIAQATATATFSGTYVFGATGTDLFSGNVAPATLTSAGVLTANDNGDGTGSLQNGFTDTLLQVNNFAGPTGACPDPTLGAQVSSTFNSIFSYKPGIGRVTAPVPTTSYSSQPPCKGFGSHFIFYLTGNGSLGSCPADTADNGNCPALVLSYGNGNYPFIGTGIAYPQATSSLTFNGGYGSTFTQFSSGGEIDASAEVTVDSTGNLSGIADATPFSSGMDVPFVGSPANPTDCLVGTPITGCFAELLSGNPPFVSPNQPFTADFYEIDSDHGFFVETDLTNSNSPSGVVSFGYYARSSLPVPPASASAKRPAVSKK